MKEKVFSTKTIKVLIVGLTLGFIFQVGMLRNAYALGKHSSPERIETLPDVLISWDVIAVPLERILLVRADTCYCAVKFTKAYLENKEFFATYESWYQGDGTEDFSKSNVKFTKRDLWSKLPIGIGRLSLIERRLDDIQCGSIILRWSGQTAIFWNPKKTGEKVETINFAPTPWISISEVDVRDPRITWYHQMPYGTGIRIPIDPLWK